MSTRARIVQRHAYLSDDFGKDYACKVFKMSEDELENKVGRYVRGKRKGLLKGKLVWLHCVSGGWLPKPYGGGAVIMPNTRAGHKIVDSWTDETIYSNIIDWKTHWDAFSATFMQRDMEANREQWKRDQELAERKAVNKRKWRVIGSAFKHVEKMTKSPEEMRACFHLLGEISKSMECETYES